MTDTVLRKTIFLKAPRQMVWDYLTQPEHLAKWFHAPKGPLKAGEPLEMFGTTSGDKLIWGEVRVANAPDHLEYSFTVGPMGDAVSTVKWILTEVPGGTQLALEHSGLPQGEVAFGLTLALDKGWDDHLMQMRGHIHDD
ncbi:SRPBCC domain-containing protein [uncultured Tateyamaria sp.]|uniref:SRPBCC family protein n=1 Tax=uncultured Tateyamaria sp. TaxID=455651 RepID=UPI00262771EF|nr:SRPBCC domain-containing protein [uncultured Tateyamaria sp.]